MKQTEIEPLLATVYAVLRAEGTDEAAEIVRGHPATAELTGNDNWNGSYYLLWERCAHEGR